MASTELRAAAQQALEALEAIREADTAGATPKMVVEARKMYEPTITALRAALAEPVQEVPWLRVIDEAMIDHHIGVADVADDYETAKRKLNILLCCAQDIGAYFAKQAEPVQEPDDPARRCGGPGCDMTCCQPVREPVLTVDALRVEFECRYRGKLGITRVEGGAYLSPAIETEWQQFVRKYTSPLQRKPLSGVAIYGLFVRSGLGAYHQKDFVVQTEYDRCIERFARAVERAHGIGGEG